MNSMPQHTIHETLPNEPQIPTSLLEEWGAVITHYPKKEFIFREGEQARYYYQIVEGRVRMFSHLDDGRERTQGDFGDGQCFGEPPLFIDQPYPAHAMAVTNCTLYKLSKTTLLHQLTLYPPIQAGFIKTLSMRIYSKTSSNKELAISSPQDRLIAFLNRYKRERQLTELTQIEYTRQEIANYTGLCVETVIRTLVNMKNENLVQIIDRKLYY